MRSLPLVLLLLAGLIVLVACGPRGLGLATPTPTAAQGAEAVVRDYFLALRHGDADRAMALSGPDLLRNNTKADLRRTYAHSQYIRFVSLQETNESLAQSSGQRAEKREYLVQLDIEAADPGAWNPGRNARFVGVIRAQDGWRVDARNTAPGFLDCDARGNCRFPTAGPVASGR